MDEYYKVDKRDAIMEDDKFVHSEGVVVEQGLRSELPGRTEHRPIYRRAELVTEVQTNTSLLSKDSYTTLLSYVEFLAMNYSRLSNSLLPHHPLLVLNLEIPFRIPEKG